MATPKFVVPTPHTANTIGVLNLVFGASILICSTLSFSSLLLTPLFQGPVLAMARSADQLAQERHEESLAAIRNLDAGAGSEAEREVYRRRLAELESEGPPRPFTADMLSAGFNTAVLRWSWLDVTTSIAVNILMIVAGVGLIQLAGWGRRLGLWVAGVKLVRLVVVWGLWIVAVVPAMSKQIGDAVDTMLRQQQGGGPPPFSFTTVYAVMYSLMGVGMILFGSIYPVVCLVALSRPGVRAACRPPAPASGSGAAGESA